MSLMKRAIVEVANMAMTMNEIRCLAPGVKRGEVDGELGPGKLDVFSALGDEVEDERDDAEVGEERGRQIHDRLNDAQPGHEEEGEEDEILLEDDGDHGQEGVDGEEEGRIAEEVALVGRGDDRMAVEISLGDLARRAVSGDDSFERSVRCVTVFRCGFLQDVAADFREDFLPFGPAGKKMAYFFEIGFELVRHLRSPS